MATTNQQKGQLKATEEIEMIFAKHGQGPKNKQLTTILVDRDLWKRFRVQCLDDGCSASGAVSTLINDYLEAKAS